MTYLGVEVSDIVVKCARRRYQKARQDAKLPLRNKYYEKLRIFHNQIDKEKAKSWKTVVEEESDRDLWSLPYK